MNLKELISNSNHIVAFTGAGISTESGIPDFRSTSGLYMTGEFEGHTPESILTSRMLRTNPKLVLKFYKHRLMRMVDKEPNRSHKVLKQLEDAGKLKAVITQNIDNLHRKCGNQTVYELHGNGTKFRCNINCGKTYTYDQFVQMVEKDELPMCECGFSFIRPNVVLFDECLDDSVFDAAYHEAAKCDLMIAIGSSLQVQPAASLLSEVNNKCKLVIINKDSTPYDRRAHLIINESCGDALEQAIQ